jgi:SET family sugar efflux transporter-like MFS transporter
VLQATNSVAVSVMTLFVAETLRLDVRWAGVALGVAAALEVPALLLVGRLNHRFSSLALIAAGCLAGIAFYAGMAAISGPLLLLALQLLNAAFFAVVAGVGLALFQEIIPRAGLASGLYTNTRRLGAIASGPIIALGSLSLGYRAVFAACAVLTVLALLVVALLGRLIRRAKAVGQAR